MALYQEADVRRNHEFFNGRNAARTPLSTVGHDLPVISAPDRTPEVLVHSETCRTTYFRTSATAVIGALCH